MPGRQFYPMGAPTDQLARVPDGLPKKAEREATSCVDQRKAAAEEAAMFFEKLAPTLNSLKCDEPEARANSGSRPG